MLRRSDLRLVLALATAAALAGCLGVTDSNPPARDVMRVTSLYDGDVVVRGPEGYCIDRRTLRTSASDGFVLLASCEVLSGVRGFEVEPVIMTLSVMPGRAGATRPTVDQIAASLPETQVIDRVTRDDVNLVHFANGGNQAFAGKDPKHWRGAMTINGHLIGLALYARLGSKAAAEGGENLLSQLATNVKNSSPVRPVLVSDDPAGSDPVPAETPPETGLGRLLGGLFPNSG